MSDERSRDADAFEGGDQTTTGATRPLTIATRGGIAIDFRTKRHEFTRREWAARQRQEARYQQEQAARARARARRPMSAFSASSKTWASLRAT
jgi:hypothetical protein